MANERYNALNTPLPTNLLKLQYISSARFDKDWSSVPHSHHCTELFFVTSGKGLFQIQERTFSVIGNDMIIINPNVLHTEIGQDGSPMEYIVLGLEGADFLSEGNDDLRFCHFPCETISPDILTCLEKILIEFKEEQPYADDIAMGWLQILLGKLQRYRQVSLTLKPSQKATVESAKIKRYIDHHFKEDISLDTLAKVAHLNKFYLSHIYKRDHGISPINYLIERRIKESKFLLADTDYNISQIASFVGFSSPSYFSQCFNRLEGTSPRAYRQRHNLKTK